VHPDDAIRELIYFGRLQSFRTCFDVGVPVILCPGFLLGGAGGEDYEEGKG